MRRASALALVLTLLALATFWISCAVVFPAPKPMRVVHTAADPLHRSQCLIVFLPGFGDDAGAFAEHGFVDALRSRGLPIDTVSANLTFGYYAKKTALERLQEDVLSPARRAGYEQIWLVGISMGGTGALLAASNASQEQDTKVAGLVLLAPYLGDDDVLREIEKAGGLAAWTPRGYPKDDYQRDIWTFLKGATRNVGAPPIYLGAGDADKLSFGHRLLAAALPTDRVYSTPGRHDWGPWGILWAEFLDRSDFRARCASP